MNATPGASGSRHGHCSALEQLPVVAEGSAPAGNSADTQLSSSGATPPLQSSSSGFALNFAAKEFNPVAKEFVPSGSAAASAPPRQQLQATGGGLVAPQPLTYEGGQDGDYVDELEWSECWASAPFGVEVDHDGAGCYLKEADSAEQAHEEWQQAVSGMSPADAVSMLRMSFPSYSNSSLQQMLDSCGGDISNAYELLVEIEAEALEAAAQVSRVSVGSIDISTTIRAEMGAKTTPSLALKDDSAFPTLGSASGAAAAGASGKAPERNPWTQPLSYAGAAKAAEASQAAAHAAGRAAAPAVPGAHARHFQCATLRRIL